MKVWNYIFIMTLLMFLFYMAGINTTTGYVLGQMDIINHPENLKNTDFYLQIVLLLSGVIAGGIAISVWTKSPAENYLIAPFIVAVLVGFVGDAISILVYIHGNYPDMQWLYLIVLAFLLPLTVGFILACVEFFRGTD